jgi:hypothetical protein
MKTKITCGSQYSLAAMVVFVWNASFCAVPNNSAAAAGTATGLVAIVVIVYFAVLPNCCCQLAPAGGKEYLKKQV